MNIPASLMWARGFEARAARVTFDGPAEWKVATQLHPTNDPQTFTAANLHYLVDSPVELSAFTQRTFIVDREFRVALHHDGSGADADRFAAALERIVREERAVFGELPAFEAPYTFISDFLPWAASDGMEHRNSAILTEPARLRVPDEQRAALSTEHTSSPQLDRRRIGPHRSSRSSSMRRIRLASCGSPRGLRTTTSR